MAQEASGSSSVPPENPDMDEEFKFLLCQNCQQEAECPNLLPCLHNVCAECLQGATLGNCCPVCQAPHSQTNMTSIQPNSFFADLRTKLGIFRKISSGQGLACDNCEKEGTHWCFDCEEFLCSVCFANHQRYLKKQSHEARAVADLRASSSKEFFSESKNVSIMFCSTKEHRMERLSIYCEACQRPMCCTCALLDYGHSSRHGHIQEEIQRRQRELLSMSSKLEAMETSFDRSCSELWEKVYHMVEEKDKTRERIRQKVTEMVQLVEKKGEMLLAAVEDEHHRKVQDVEEKLQNAERVAQRLASGRQLVDTMQLYASDQEVLDMYPFVRKSLEKLTEKRPPVGKKQRKVGNFAEVKSRLQTFYERVMNEKEGPPPTVATASNQKPSGKSSAKRKHVENTSQTPTRFIKIEANDEQPGTSSGKSEKEPVKKRRKAKATLHLILAKRPRSDAKDTETIPKIRFSVSPSESSNTDPPSCLYGGTEDISSHDEPLGSIRQEDINSWNSQDGFHPPRQHFSGQGCLVFFDMKVLPEIENTLQLVAVKDETKCFSIIIQPGGYEHGLESFLHYLLTLRQPILVGYNLWSRNLALLVKCLKALRKEEAFQDAVFGFLDALPLIKEKLPNRRSYTLKSLYRDSFKELLDDGQPLDCAKALKDLCTVLEVNPGMDRRPVIPYSSLQNYVSLQPLLGKHLNHSTTEALALNGICFSTLLSKYQKDPAHGLKQFARFFNSRQINSKGTIRWLSRVQNFFKSLLSSSRGLASAATTSRTCSPN